MTTYRTDFTDAGTDKLHVSYFDGDLAAARKMARIASKAHGAAYVIATDHGQDTGQIAYFGGRADSRDFQA